MSLKNNVRNKTKNIYWVFYIQENLKQSEKNKFKEKPGEKMFLKNFCSYKNWKKLIQKTFFGHSRIKIKFLHFILFF